MHHGRVFKVVHKKAIWQPPSPITSGVSFISCKKFCPYPIYAENKSSGVRIFYPIPKPSAELKAIGL